MADITTTTAETTSSIPTGEERVQQIKNMYDANLNATKSNLEASYQQNLSNAQADKAKIADTYTGEKNNLASNYERQRRNNNMQAASNGLNTGAGSQMALAQQANYQSNMSQLGKAQANAEGEADRNISDITMQYQSAVNEAVAQNDYQKAAALLDEYNNQKNERVTQAQTLAQYGDFSGYASLYGQATADNMSRVWALSNPDLAYTTGKITADDYYKMTGSYPNGYSAPYSGGGGGYSSYVTPGDDKKVTDPTALAESVYQSYLKESSGVGRGDANAKNTVIDRGNIYSGKKY